MFTQSVGLLSYTFMTQTGHDRIVVPMVDYELDISTRVLKNSHHYSKEHFRTNLSMLLEWSPYGNEAGLIKQFDDIGDHGTKVIIYNLWFSDDGDLELDFESDPKDILISGAPKSIIGPNHLKNIIEQHVANRFHFSLRVYSSILYLRVPEHFKIILRGHVVEHYNIAKDLQFPEFIMYKPKVGGFLQVCFVVMY
ncbi:hypothetical protein GIB67_014071 [Kingdonia uniflora]|uniref:Morc S5 domain-containing protein n=1 Tax=Kingdonia uniflora TaxID=39325 RepID=A0A7J7KXJ5_9MAGN|nr:hypothetical protein GIB67_014071 [Kingdonia uniflora]